MCSFRSGPAFDCCWTWGRSTLLGCLSAIWMQAHVESPRELRWNRWNLDSKASIDSVKYSAWKWFWWKPLLRTFPWDHPLGTFYFEFLHLKLQLKLLLKTSPGTSPALSSATFYSDFLLSSGPSTEAFCLELSIFNRKKPTTGTFCSVFSKPSSTRPFSWIIWSLSLELLSGTVDLNLLLSELSPNPFHWNLSLELFFGTCRTPSIVQGWVPQTTPHPKLPDPKLSVVGDKRKRTKNGLQYIKARENAPVQTTCDYLKTIPRKKLSTCFSKNTFRAQSASISATRTSLPGVGCEFVYIWDFPKIWFCIFCYFAFPDTRHLDSSPHFKTRRTVWTQPKVAAPSAARRS